MAKSGMALKVIMARKPDVDVAKIDATTEQDIHRHMRKEGYHPDEAVRDEDIVLAGEHSQAARSVATEFSRRHPCSGCNVAELEQGQTLMDLSARALTIILAREPEAALRAPGYRRAAGRRLCDVNCGVNA